MDNTVPNYTISIVIPCRNEENYIGRCLASIIASDYDKSKLNVIVCDGMSDDSTPAIVQEYASKHPFIHYVENVQKTTPQALNLGLKHLPFDIGIILGAHAEIYTDYISNCVRAFQAQPEAACVGGIIENVHENQNSQIIGLAMSSRFGVGNAHFRTGTKSGFVDTVAFGAYKKEVFETCGYFDEELVRNQDDEFNFRILKNGFKIWLDPRIKSKYFVRASYSKLYKQYLQYGYWKVYVNRKHKAVTTIRQLFPAGLVAFLIFGAIASLFSKYLFAAYAAVLVLYITLAALFAAKSMTHFSQWFNIMRTFFILHIGYGWGYIKGIVDFLILNKKPATKQSSLTR